MTVDISTISTGSSSSGKASKSTGASSDRDKFNNKFEYFFTALSYAVGLGNVWRFPYLCYRNGGGSFLIPYLFSLLFLGLTFFFFESSIGQYTSLGTIQVWRLTPIFKGIGWAMFLMNFYVGIYYNMIVAWSLYYLYASFTALPSLPWSGCGNAWNTEACFNHHHHHKDDHLFQSNDTLLSNSSSLVGNFTSSVIIVTTNATQSPSQQFFYHQVLQMTTGIDDLEGGFRPHLVISLAAAWTIVFFGLSLGTKSLGKISYFTAIFPYLMITALLVNGIQLEGAMEGILHYIKPDFARLQSVDVWADAATQIFFSLSITMGGVITLASYNHFYNNTMSDSLLIVVSNSLTSIYAGFAIFSVIGFMAKAIGKPIDQAADQGVGLAFVAYPAALSRLPYAPLWSVVFFLMLITLGFGTILTVAETIVSTLVDFWPAKLQKRKLTVLAFVCLIMFLCGLPMCTGAGIYILQLMDSWSVPYSAFAIAIAEVVAIAWVYGIDRHLANIGRMLGRNVWPRLYWKIMFKYICPVVIAVILCLVLSKLQPVRYNDYTFPLWTEYIGYALAGSSVAMIPLFMLFEVSKVLRGCKAWKDIFRPEVDFGNDGKDSSALTTMSTSSSSSSSSSEFGSGQLNSGYVVDGGDFLSYLDGGHIYGNAFVAGKGGKGDKDTAPRLLNFRSMSAAAVISPSTWAASARKGTRIDPVKPQ